MSESGLDVAGRYALVYAALWPDTIDTPELTAETRSGRRDWPADVRAAAVTAYQAGGGSYAAVGAHWGVPSTTVKDWVRRARLA